MYGTKTRETYETYETERLLLKDYISLIKYCKIRGSINIKKKDFSRRKRSKRSGIKEHSRGIETKKTSWLDGAG